MEQEARFVIQGVDYPFPTLDSLTVGEARILGQMTTGDVAEILSGEAETASMDVVAAMMVIAYMRGNPNASRKMAERIVDSIPLADLVMPEGDAGPPGTKAERDRAARLARKQRRLRAIFWRRFQQRFGPPGQPGAVYWDARVAHAAHLRPADIDALTFPQLMEAADLFDSLYQRS